MSQKSLITIAVCTAAVLIIWMLRGSLCEFHLTLWGAEFAASLQHCNR
ncbi:Hok/Gef family protein [Salmonella enterica subsp. enterica serovar Newport]|uniref:Hok/gef family protein n=1 Tax=Salmonella newport TaxID=108619 RepID=A0A5U9KXG7_SALNE|nr:hok/gef family protein [Salmonella enterica subsp. enterica serovar Newport]EDE6686994.1 Hok/Gef family protein [Salmonella enterica subsp. enterica serovar Apeyeme]EEJ5313320.1 Hok/Gef family protein [Salmonella enterica]EGQ2009693.1 Hok/Gef family protein [Salmonella enterica subsp. enterica serovar Infantis]HBJ6316867.1 Hok/Gef family protein [Salmonella enterica subsp. diarizonae serovar 50:r:z]